MKTISMQIKVSVPDDVSDDDAKRVIAKILSIGQQEAHDSVEMDGKHVFPGAKMAKEFEIYNPSISKIEASNAILRDVFFGLQAIEKAHNKAVKADPSDAPCTLDLDDAKIYLSALQSAYQHALEMCNYTSLQAFVEALSLQNP